MLIPLELFPIVRPNKKVYVFRVTWNFKIRTVGLKIFFILFLYEVNRKTIWLNREIPTKTLKNFTVGGEKLGTVG